MPSYRGIDQKDILSSLQNAESFVHGLDLGPVSERLLDHWLAGEPFSKIAGAKDDKALAQALQDTRSGLFSWFSDVIEHHAKEGASGRAVYTALANWDGLKINTHVDDWLVDNVPLDEEVHNPNSARIQNESRKLFDEHKAHVILDFAQRLTPEDALGGAPFLGKFQLAIDQRAKHMMMKPQALADFMPVLLTTLKEQGPVAARDALLAQSDTHCGFVMNMKDVLVIALDIKRDTSALDDVSRFGKYGIVAEDFGLFSDLRKVFEPLEPRIDAVLKPFADKGEVVETGISMITAEPRFDANYAKYGYWFRATRETAEAVANAFPDLEVIDHATRRIMPQAGAPAPAPKAVRGSTFG